MKKQLISKQLSAGFTLIETLVVLIVVGILAAMAGPSWVNFINQRRINATNDAILRALQDAQQQARNKKLSYSVSFVTDNTTNLPKFFIYPDNSTTPPSSNWPFLGQDVGIKSGQAIIGTNLSGENTASTSFSYASTTAQTITFDFKGNLLTPANLGDKGLIIAVAVPQAANSTLPIDSSRRCVKVITLLGALQIGKEIECNAQ